MKSKERAIKWWNDLCITDKLTYTNNYLGRDDFVNITSREIERIWVLEVLDRL